MTELRKGSPILWLLLTLFALALLAWALRTVPLAEIGRILTQISGEQIFVLFLVNGAIVLLLGMRWWLILRAQGYQLPFLSIARYRLAAFGVSYFTPGPHFGGEPLQVIFLHQRHAVDTSSALASVTLDKVIELLSNFGFLSVAIALVLRNGILGSELLFGVQAVSVIFLFLPVLYLSALLLGQGFVSRLLANTEKNWAEAVKGGEEQLIELLRENRTLLLSTLMASILVWFALLLEYWLALRFLGLNLSLIQLLAIVVAARLAMLAPTPGALGALEAAQVLAMQTLGFDPAFGLSLSLLIRARDLLFGGLGLWLGGRALRQ